MDQDIKKIKNLKNGPLNYSKLRLVESEEEPSTIAKYLTSEFHQTTKYWHVMSGKPISKIIDLKNLNDEEI